MTTTTPGPSLTNIPPSYTPQDFNNLIAPRIGGVSSLRWRGSRFSAPFLTLLEAVLGDISSLTSRVFQINPVPTITTIPNAQNNLNPNVRTWERASDTYMYYAIQILSIRRQIDFLLETPVGTVPSVTTTTTPSPTTTPHT